MLKPARSRRFVVGYLTEGSCAYGKAVDGKVRYVDPMTELRAHQYLKREMTSTGVNAAVFELVPVAIYRLEQKGARLLRREPK